MKNRCTGSSHMVKTILEPGMRVLKYTGDYQLEGEIRSVFTTKAGKTRYVVEHDPGFLHIYSERNIKLNE